MKYTYAILERKNEIEDIENQWKALEKHSDNKSVSVSFDWVMTWWDTFSKKENNQFGYHKGLKVVVAKDNDNCIVFICPLILLYRKISIFKIYFLEFLGQQWGATTFSFLIDKGFQFNFKEIEHFLKKNIKYHVLYLRSIPHHLNGQGGLFLRPFSGCFEVNINEHKDYKEYYSTLSKGSKQNMRTAFNRAVKQNDEIKHKVFSGNNMPWDEIIRISRTKLSDGKDCLYDSEEKKEFYKKINKESKTNAVCVYVDDKMVAYRYNIIYNIQKFCIDASYDRDYPKYNLGLLSVNYNIEDSFKDEMLIHSMGPGLYDYKKRFTKNINFLSYTINKGNKICSKILAILFLKYIIRKNKKAE